MLKNTDICDYQILHPVSQHREEEYNVLLHRLSEECDTVFSDRQFTQKLYSLFQE